jgi:hypothetical protein
MLMRKITFIFFYLFTLFSFSQEYDHYLDFKLKRDREVFQIVNKSNTNFNLFLIDKKKVNSLIVDRNFKLVDSVATDRPKKEFTDVIGNSGDFENPTIYWSNEYKNLICAQKFDLKTKEVKKTYFENIFNQEEEFYLNSFTSDNKFFIITIDRKNSLRIYEFFQNTMKGFVFNLSSEKFYDSDKKNVSLNWLFDIYNGDLRLFEDSNTIEKVENNTLIDLSISAKKRKFYCESNKLIITLDFCNELTQIIKIDLESKTIVHFDIEKPKLKVGDFKLVKSNSFLIDNKIFQLVLNNEQLILSCKKISGEILNEYIINESDTFNINNTPFTIENINESERELKSTSQFLRKINRSNIGISSFKIDGNFAVTLGSVSAETPNNFNNAFTSNNAFGFNSNTNFPNYNFYFYNYNRYKNRRTISTICLFDNQIKHIKSDVKEFAFDKITKFEKNFNHEISGTTIFEFNNNIVYGFYDIVKQIYCFKKFNK